MLDFISMICKIVFLVCLTIFLYTAFKFPYPDFYALKVMVWCLIIFGLVMGIKDTINK